MRKKKKRFFKPLKLNFEFVEFKNLLISSTVIRIKPKDVDFYHSKGAFQIADRIVYRLSDLGWTNEHVYA